MNFADNIQVVENILHSNPFVQQVINFKSKVPSVICYLPDQIQDMKIFCAVPDGAVLGFDKTFNLADIHVTVAVFKHKAVRKYDTRDHPIFFGPFFFHGNCDELVYNQFMSELSRHLTREEQTNILFGSDEEATLRNSIRHNFPFSKSFVCSRHLKNNVKRNLSDQIGMGQNDREKIVHELFGVNGIWSESDSEIIKTRMGNMINSRIEKNFIENCELPRHI